MKFKELLNFVDNGQEVRVLIKVYGIKFISTHYKGYYTTKEFEPLLQQDVDSIEALDDVITVTLK